MQLPSLSIQTTPAKIGIQTQNASLDIHTAPADLSIEQPTPELNITSKPARVMIDSTQAWNNLNLKSAFVRIKEAAENGHQAVLEGIARRVQEGDQLMHIDRKSNAIKQIAEQHAFQSDGGYDTGSVPPSEAVQITVEPGELNIEASAHQPVFNVQTHAPDISYTPGNVSIYLTQHPDITIEPQGLYLDQKG